MLPAEEELVKDVADGVEAEAHTKANGRVRGFAIALFPPDVGDPDADR